MGWPGIDPVDRFLAEPGGVSNIAIWSGTNGGSDPGGDLNIIPEPASLFLLGAGLIGLGLTRRRKPA